LNRLGTLHGGLIATLIDITGSLAVASHGLEFTGVSTDISVSYIGSAKLGNEINITAICEKLGLNLCFTSAIIRHGDKLIAQGRHTKYIKNQLLQ